MAPSVRPICQSVSPVDRITSWQTVPDVRTVRSSTAKPVELAVDVVAPPIRRHGRPLAAYLIVEQAAQM
jgi:hypothetical protein